MHRFIKLDRPTRPVDLKLELGGRLEVHRAHLPPKRSRALFEELLHTIPWAQSDLRMAGRIVKTPRLQCWMGDEGVCPQVYSKTRAPWSPSLATLRDELSAAFCPPGRPINYVLLNLYQDGKHSISYHADNEVVEDGDVIVSVSLGASRRFLVRPKPGVITHPTPSTSSTKPTTTTPTTTKPTTKPTTTPTTHALDLHDGDVVVMDGRMQRNYVHSVPKTARPVGPRINLTFRRA